MRILLVDDDPLQTEWLRSELGRRFPSAQFEEISTESGFRDKLADIENSPPDVVLLDVMLRWTDVAEVMPPVPSDVAEGKYFRAGLRCLGLMAKRSRTRDLPVILLTVLDEADLANELENLPPNVVHVPKTADPEVLDRKIFELTRRRR